MNETDDVNKTDDIPARLKRARLQPTGLRVKLLTVLASARKPMTAAELAAAIGGGVRVVAVYRVIRSLVQAGVIVRVNDGRPLAKYIRVP